MNYDKNNVGIIGYWFATNYGGVASYYSLYNEIKKLGYDPFLVENPYYKTDKEGMDVFSRNFFIKCGARIAPPHDNNELKEYNKLADTFVLGSDQVLTTSSIRAFGKLFLMEFAEEQKKKIAFSASCGGDTLTSDAEQANRAKMLVNRFNAFSVREKAAERICAEKLGIKPDFQIDPIFFLKKESIKELIGDSEPPKEKYMLAYILDPDEDKRKGILKIANELNIDFKVALDGRKFTHSKNEKLIDLGEKTLPELDETEWLKYYYYSDFVVTDSFHGTALALVLNKPFICYANKKRGMPRFETLSEIFDLKSRIIFSSGEIGKALKNSIDFDKITKQKIISATEGEEWLKKFLNKPVQSKPHDTEAKTNNAVKTLKPFYGIETYNSKKNEPYNICQKNICTGCSACYNSCPVNAIEMKEDNEGFLYPNINDEVCIKCGKCERVCPVLNPTDEKLKANMPPNAIYAAYSLDEEARFMSTSGGAFSEFAKYILSLDGICFGAAYDDDFNIRHISIGKIDEIPRIRQSKYYQSVIGDSFAEVRDNLEKDKYVLFCGTPCQTAGLANYLGEGYRSKYPKLFIVDFVCHSINSPKAFKAYLKELEENSANKAERVWFKNKENGWHNFSSRIDFKDTDKFYLKTCKQDSFMQGFLTYRCFLRPSCHDCHFKEFKRTSDITLADFWGLKWNDENTAGTQEKGVSIVMTNTTLGAETFEKIKDRLYYEQHKLEEIKPYNGGLYYSQRVGMYRDFFFQEVDRTPFSQIISAIAKREAELHANPSGGITGKITKIGNVIINMHPTARITVKNNAELILNSNLPTGSNQECILILHKNSELIINGTVRLCYGSVLQLFENAKLTMDGGFVNAYATFALKFNTKIGKDFLCGRHLCFLDSDHHKIINTVTGEHINAAKSNVTIGNHVWLGEGVTITKEVTIGDNSVIGTHAVVTKSIPANCLAVGNPAKVIKEYITWED